jgi:subtilisin family serine protease
MYQVPVQPDSQHDVIDRGLSVAEIPGLRNLWHLTRGDSWIKIAVLDGPVDTSHSAFTGADMEIVEVMVPVKPNIDGLATLHGTQVASLILGQHEPISSVQGVAPRCKGFIVPIYQDHAPGLSKNLACSQLDLARALLVAAEHGATVINISSGEFIPTGRAHLILADAILDCTRRDILIVAAVGNEGCDCLHVPAVVSGVLAVGAMNWDGEPLASSNWGSSIAPPA